MEPEAVMQDAIWPWIEANQGLVSVVALGVALAIAVYEVLRANRLSEAWRRDEAKVAATYIFSVRELREHATRMRDSNVDPLSGKRSLDLSRKRIVDLGDALEARLQNARLAMVMRAWCRELADHQLAGATWDDTMLYLVDLEQLADLREAYAFGSVYPHRERIWYPRDHRWRGTTTYQKRPGDTPP